MNRCECDESGWCERHKVTKGVRMHELCDHADHPAYWEAWEGGYGPGQKAVGLGDRVAKAIAIVTDGRIKPCGGCKERQAALNELGRKPSDQEMATAEPASPTPGDTERN